MSFNDRTRQLDLALNKASGEGESCFTTTYWIIAAIVPVVIAVVLYLWKPSWIMNEDDLAGKTVDLKKLALWTIIPSAVIWGGMYGYSVYSCSS